MKKTGLGKGLDALFINNIEEIEEIKEGEVIEKIKIIDIEPNKEQPRKVFDEEALQELSNSIKEYGVIQPIIVIKKDNYYKIVAGERRWRAAKKAGLKEVPAIVREYNDKENSEVALIENIQRQNLNPMEKAIAIKNLMQSQKMTQQDVATKLGMSRSAVANAIRIINLDKRVIELVEEGKLTEGHCKALLAVEDSEKQYLAAKHMIEYGESVRSIEDKIKKAKTKKGAKKYDAIYKDIEKTFREFFGTKVKLSVGKKSGKIIIEYSNNEDLERIIGLVK
ncbi:MAG: ParB/RepB/Spo0J family partition protein [Lachnospiraceae bacterium]|jgi:ParB family chromosome partitioning protein|nr:ParB/RepB/Spo0J family partition protein [Lachnospiraceae bacterium]